MYTSQQEAAVAARGVSIALSAGAGCGKTFVLTERFLAELEPDREAAARVHELVAITFTRKAAREMRDRIRQKCRARHEEAEDPEAAHWRRLLRELDHAYITTIDAFCAGLLRAHAVEAGVDPNFVVIEDGQRRTLLREAVDDVLRDRWRESPGILDLLSGLDLAGLRDALDELLKFRRWIEFDHWLACAPDDLCAHWKDRHKRYSHDWLADFLKQKDTQTLRKIAATVEMGNTRMRERFSTILAVLDNLPHAPDLAAEIRRLREAATVQHVPAGQWPESDLYEAFKAAAGRLRSQCDALLELEGAARGDNLEAARWGLALLELGHAVLEEYDRRKARDHFLDFDDLLMRAQSLLSGSHGEAVARRLCEQTRLVLVDEFQDTDRLQVGLVEALCGQGILSGKLFFVGDHKQSIYRFRGARPEVFRNLTERIPQHGRLSLTHNFRSQPEILHFANALFAEEFSSDYEPLEPRRGQASPPPCVEFLWALPPADAVDKQNKDEARRREADWIARRIRQMLDAREPIVVGCNPFPEGAPATREPRRGDIAILFRALSDIHHYEEALERYGLDYYVVGGKAFYSRQEVFDVLNALRSIADPDDEVSLAGALRGPMFALDDTTLLQLANAGGLSAGLWSTEARQALSPERARRAQFAADSIDALRQAKDVLPVADLLKTLLNRTGFDAALLADFMGERKLANVMKLVEMARAVDSRGLGIDDFVYELGEFVAQLPPEAPAATHAERSDVVRLMSIHQSKGLEFPIVFIADLNRAVRNDTPRALFHPELGPLVRPPSEAETGSLGYELFRRVEGAERDQEELRLLYVAVTRAADRLILCGGFEKELKPSSAWMRILDSRFDLHTGSCRAPIPPAWPIPKVRVVTQEPPAVPRDDLKSRAIIPPSEQLRDAGHRVEPLPRLVRPIPPDVRSRRRYSFSRLSGQLRRELDMDASTRRGSGTEKAPLEFGSLVHALLEVVDFSMPPCALPPLAKGCADEYPALDPRAIHEAAELVAGLLESPLARHLAAATELYRECEFLLPWTMSGDFAGESVTLHGIVDCAFRDVRGRWHVLDYKTHRAAQEELPFLAKNYRTQLAVYGMAVEQATGDPPESLMVHFLRAKRTFTFRLDAQTRAETSAEVDAAIAQLREAE